MPTFEREAPISIFDLMSTGLQPSRAEGPPDPDAPMFTWARGLASDGEVQPIPPPPTPPAVLSPRPVTATPAAASPPPTPAGAFFPQTPPEQLLSPEQIPDFLLFENGLLRFGGKELFLDASELAAIAEIALMAYERAQREERTALHTRYVLAQARRQAPLYQPSGAGQEVVQPMHWAQEEIDFEAAEMQEVWDASDAGAGDVRTVLREDERVVPPTPEPRHSVPRKAARRKKKS